MRKNHTDSCVTWQIAAGMATLSLFLLLVAIGSSSLLAAGSNLFKVSKISVEATEKNAVAAKQKALEDGERRALRILLKRIIPLSSYSRIPELKPSVVTSMVQGFSVRKEQYSSTRYLATLDYQFQSDAVRRLLARYNIPFLEKQSNKVVLVPAVISSGELVKKESSFWRRAWLNLDLENAITPIKLERVDANLTEQRTSAVLAGDQDMFDTVRNDYGERYFVLALAELANDGNVLNVRLVGIDEIGRFDLNRFYRTFGDPLAAADMAAKVSLGIIEGRWKAVTETGPAHQTADSARSDIFLTVEFSGFSHWQTIRSKLSRVPGVESLNIESLSARGAEVTLNYPGGADSLSRALAAHGLSLENVGGAWILRSF